MHLPTQAGDNLRRQALLKCKLLCNFGLAVFFCSFPPAVYERCLPAGPQCSSWTCLHSAPAPHQYLSPAVVQRCPPAVLQLCPCTSLSAVRLQCFRLPPHQLLQLPLPVCVQQGRQIGAPQSGPGAAVRGAGGSAALTAASRSCCSCQVESSRVARLLLPRLARVLPARGPASSNLQQNFDIPVGSNGDCHSRLQASAWQLQAS